jgi:hypothetical protein
VVQALDLAGQPNFSARRTIKRQQATIIAETAGSGGEDAGTPGSGRCLAAVAGSIERPARGLIPKNERKAV